MKSPSLLFRLVVLQLALALTIIVVFAASAVWFSSRALERQETSYLTDAASLVANALTREWSEEGDLPRAAVEALKEDSPPEVQVDILDAEGRLVLSTARVSDRRPASGRREMRIHVPRGATVVASISTRPRRRAISVLLLGFAVTGVPLFGAVLILSRTLAGRALSPLSRMAAQAESTPLRSQAHPLGRPGDPAEVSALAGAFNRLVARLEESLSSERSFTQDAAHELRTPITVLGGELEYALSDSALPEKHRSNLAHAHDQVRQMSELVDALLVLRQADAEPELDAAAPVDLGDLVREAARELLEHLPRRSADLRIEAEDEALVSGHAALLLSAVRNLLSNAFKFTREGERVIVTVGNRAGLGRVVVEDAGPGVEPAERERIFDPFFRSAEARASREGFGLGLPILRRVARAHGGDVVVSSSPLGGARFELSVPAWDARGLTAGGAHDGVHS